MNKKILNFCFKCWMTCLVLGVISHWLLILYIEQPDLSSSPSTEFFRRFAILLVLSFFGTICSIPFFILFSLINAGLTKYRITASTHRVIISICSLLIWLFSTILFVGNSFYNKIDGIVFLPYLVILLFGIWSFKIKFKTEEHDMYYDEILDTPI